MKHQAQESGAAAPDVLIVGAGPAGLSLACELGMRGIRALLIEQNARTGQQPRAKTTNVRSMEHFRRWGVADKLRARAPLPATYPTDISFRTRMFGEKLSLIRNAFSGSRMERDPRFSEPAQWVPQYKVEAVLLAHAQSLPGIEIRFGCRLDSISEDAGSEDAGSVTAQIRDLNDDSVSTVRTRYVVGADGARSQVRTMIGAKMEGRHAFAKHMGLVIRAPALREVMQDEPAIMYWLLNQDAPAVSSPMDENDLWTFSFSVGLDQDYSETQLRARLAASYGRDVQPEIIKVDPWAAHSLVASRYATDRVFLIGDACHLHPPYGGYGMNLGIADAVDLGWKLAATLEGWGGAQLLASYEAERRPVHRRVIDEAVTNHATLPHNMASPEAELPGPEGDAARVRVAAVIQQHKVREFHTLGVVLGYNYAGSPLIVPDGTSAPSTDYEAFVPTACPGSLAPHVWLEDGRSLYDVLGTGYTLLIADHGADDAVQELRAEAARRKVPLTLLDRPAPGLGDLYGARLALIRPDQHVAWRGDGLECSPSAIFDRILGAEAREPALTAAQ